METQNMKVYELVDNDLNPTYQFSKPEEAIQFAEKKLNPLELEVYTPQESPDYTEIKNQLIYGFKESERQINSDLNREIDNGNWEKAENEAEYAGTERSLRSTAEYNFDNSNKTKYCIQAAADIINHAKVMQGIRGGKPKQNYVEKINDQLREVYENASD